MLFLTPLPPSPVAQAFRGIQWNALEKLRLSASESSTLRAAEDNPLDYTLAEHERASAYARVILKILNNAAGPSGPSSKVSKLKENLLETDSLQMLHADSMGVVTHYAITKLCEIVLCLSEMRETSMVTIFTTFYKETDGTLMEDWRPLFRVLHLGGSGDAFTQRGAAFCLAYILIAGCPFSKLHKTSFASIIPHSFPSEEPLRALIAWIISQLQSSGAYLSLVTPTLVVLMSNSEARKLFADSGGIGCVSKHISVRNNSNANSKRKESNGATAQQLYELCFCLWTMTYECNMYTELSTHFVREGAVAALVGLLSIAPREKVVRVAVSALRNLATTACNAEEGNGQISGTFFLGEMIGCGLIKSIDIMNDRQWTDPDIVDDLQILHSLLHENYKEMSRWDRYQAEVESGHLEWGAIHTEKFFQANAKDFEGPDSDFALLKFLIKLVVSDDDDDIVAIACFDIGEFVRNYPNGRSIAKRLGAKEAVMNMINHENLDVQRHALQCVSKIMVQNWAAIH